MKFFKIMGNNLLGKIKNYYRNLSQKEKIVLVLLFSILIFAFILRLLFIIKFPQHPVREDAELYNRLGRNILLKGQFSAFIGQPFAGVPPLYPSFLALIYALFGYSFQAVRIAQVFIDTMSCFIIFLIGKNIYDKKLGLIAAFISSIYFSFSLSTGLLLTETLSLFLIVLTIYFLTKVFKEFKKKDFILAGVFSSLTTLCRAANLGFFLFVVFIMIIFYYRKKKDLWKYITYFFIVSVLVLLPWVARNSIIFSRFTIATGGGASFWIGNYLPSNGHWSDEAFSRFYIKYPVVGKRGIFDPRNEGVFYREGIKNIISYLKKNPIAYLQLLGNKFLYLWEEPYNDYRDKFFPFYSWSDQLIFHKFLLFFAVIGIILAFFSRNKEIIPLLSVLFYYTFIYIGLYAIPRYNMPIMPIVIIFSSYAILIGYRLVIDIIRER